MYSLDVIQSLNRKAPKPAESETTRHCSYAESEAGTVLHSAKQRNTVHLSVGPRVDTFRRKILSAGSSQQKRDEIIESYFS